MKKFYIDICLPAAPRGFNEKFGYAPSPNGYILGQPCVITEEISSYELGRIRMLEIRTEGYVMSESMAKPPTSTTVWWPPTAIVFIALRTEEVES